MSCSHPKIYKNRIVPCGCCINCRKKRQNDWAVRLDIERKLNQDKSLFITLTYSDDYLPEDGLLNKRDYQLFIKRLRKSVAPVKLRYFLSGEYGEKYGRPHYHLILFGLELNQENIKLINDKWNMGFTKILPVTWKNCRYVAKYSVKQFQKERKAFKVDGITGEVSTLLVSEFVSMSRRNGLGFGIFTQNKEVLSHYFQGDGFVSCGDYKYSIPKAFKSRLKEYSFLNNNFEKVVILWNDKVFSTFEHFKNNCFHDYFISLQIDWHLGRFLEKVEFVSFKDYLKDLALVSMKEINFCKIRKIDYFQFYFNKIKRFLPFIYSKNSVENKKVFDFMNEYFKDKEYDFSSFSAYRHFIDSFFYSNFDFLFY